MEKNLNPDIVAQFGESQSKYEKDTSSRKIPLQITIEKWIQRYVSGYRQNVKHPLHEHDDVVEAHDARLAARLPIATPQETFCLV